MVAGSRNQNKARCLNEIAGFLFRTQVLNAALGYTWVTSEKEFAGYPLSIGAERPSNAPITAAGIPSHDRIAVETQEAQGGGKNAETLILGLVQKLTGKGHATTG